MKLLGSKSVFKFLKKGAAYSVSIFVVLLVYFGFYITGCENDTYFASSTFLCDNSVQGVSCEEASLSHEDRTGVNQRSSSQNLLAKQSAADMTDFSSGRLITIRSRLDKVNILFVIDNSSSMNKEQESIANQFDDFLDTLDDWDYHIAIITTDPGNLGNFISFPNGELFLSNPKKRRSVHKKNIRYFQRTVRRPVGAYPEEGIASLNRALEKRSQRDFFRPHSLFLVIIVSDDDEAGGPHAGKSLQFDNQPETFFEKVSDLYPYSVVTVHSIIFEPGDSKSSCPNGDAPGYVYASASRPSRSIMKRYGNILKGHIGSICSPNYSRQLGPIADHTMKSRLLPLPCLPLDDSSVLVEVDGRPVDFDVKGRKVFIEDRVPFGAEIEMSFRCRR